MTRYMGDSTTLTDIPLTVDMAAAYINGTYAAPAPAFATRFPGKPRLYIDVDGTAKQAQVRDWENGDKAGSLEQWVLTNENKWPTVYCDRSTIAEVRNLTGRAVLGKDYWLWVATLDGTYSTSYQEAPAGVVAVQAWGQNLTGGHWDKSIVFADWWYPSAPITPPVIRARGVVVTQSLGTLDVSSVDGKTWTASLPFR